jgi:hypothetical protein
MQNNNNTNKLVSIQNTNYNRPRTTYTDKINKDKDEMMDKLEDYVEENNISNVKLGTHIRYFKNENGKKRLIMGGNLINKSGVPRYIVLSNGRAKWSVQLDSVIQFYRKMTIDEIKEDYDEMIDEYEKKIKMLKKVIKELKMEINELKK